MNIESILFLFLFFLKDLIFLLQIDPKEKITNNI